MTHQFKLIAVLLIALLFITPSAIATDFAFGKTVQVSNTSNWSTGTIPTTTSNMVDADDATVTGYGRINQTLTNINYVQIDLGSIELLGRIYYHVGLVTSEQDNSCVIYDIQTSSDNVTFTAQKTASLCGNSASAEQTFNLTYYNMGTVYSRYVRISAYKSGDVGATPYVQIRFYQFEAHGIELITPVNGTSLTKAYPPLTTNINFSWSPANAVNLVIAKDQNFNVIAVNTTIANIYSIQSLEAGSYWWKVRYYNSTDGSYGSYSSVFNFTITNNISTTGIGIHGVVYEVISGTNVPVSGATVYISNSTSTWSNYQIVGSNGYYFFDNLAANTTYYLVAKATGYDNSVTEYVTTAGSNFTSKDIKLTVCISGQDCFGIKNYVKFVATDFFGNLYSNVDVDVYKGSDIITTYTGTTGTDGSITFLLTKDQSYRLDFSGANITITTITITPGESTLYYVFVSASSPRKYWDNASYQPVDVIRTGVTTNIIGTTGYVNVTYTDYLSQTTAWTIFLNQTNHTNSSAPQVTIASSTGAGNASVSFALLSGFTGESYIVNIKAQHTTFGQVLRSYGVQFYGTKDGSLDFIPSAIMALIAIMILIFVGSFFDSTNYAQGAGLVCAIGWIEVGLGMYTYANMYISVIIGLSIASVIAIVANMNERNKREVVG